MSYPSSDYNSTAEYRAPISPRDSRPDWLPSSPLVDTIFGKGYVDEGDPSWEEVIAMVVIPGNPTAIYNAAGSWEVLFSRIEQAQAMLDQLNWNLQGWQGAAADTYRERLNGLSMGISELVQKHRPVVSQLNTAADNLQNAMEHTPIPDDMVDQVMEARRNYERNGAVDAQTFRPGSIFDKLFPIMSNRWLADVGSFLTFGFSDWVTDKLRDWISDEDDKAKAAYRRLADDHVTTMDSMPSGATIVPNEIMQRTVHPNMTDAPPPPSTTGTPSGYGTGLAGAGGGGMPAGGVPGSGPGTGIGSTGGLAGSGSGIGAGPGAGGVGPVSMPGSSSAASASRAAMGGMPMGGMAGAGASGAAGARSGGAGKVGMGGGVPMGGMAGAGGAGAGGGSRGAGRAGMGGMPMGGMGAGGAGAAGGARGAGAGGAGGAKAAGGARGVTGMPMGAGAGHGAGGEGETHSTWLNEDDDVWGADSDAPPSVLGG